MKILNACFVFAVMFVVNATQVFAAEGIPRAWHIGLQDGFTPVKDRIHAFHDLVFVIITGIVVVVFGLLAYVMWRYRESKNPVPAKFTHNYALETIWTIIPVIILVIIAIPSMKLLYYMDKTADPDMTLVVYGYQWYWGYEYPDQEIEEFQAHMIPDEEIDPAEHIRLLSTDQVVVLPINKDIQILVTGKDVLHSFAVPSFGIKSDAIPGRFKETWARVKEEGIFYGQCSELCGVNHAFMPSEIHAVKQDVFEEWAVLAKDDIDAATEFIRDYQRKRKGVAFAKLGE
jgi:cytochrome c oxidase subunit 2